MATEDWWEVLGEGLRVSLQLPVAPSERSITATDVATQLLDAIALLEDGPQGVVGDDPPSPELLRLEVKVDLLMNLVSASLADKIPRRTSVTLSSGGLVLPASVLPAAADRIELFPCHWLWQPVVLGLGEVRTRGEERGAAWGSPDPGLRDALGRWVFRMHRREVARRRLQAAGTPLDASSVGGRTGFKPPEEGSPQR